MTAAAEWIGRSLSRADRIDPWPGAALLATLGIDRPAPGPGEPLPLLWHWLHFHEAVPRAELGPDGHPATGRPGGLVPPMGAARRMWAGGRFEVHGPLPVGAPARQVSRLAAVGEKTGRRGPFTLVTLVHEVHGPEGLALTEAQDLVYRAGDGAPADPAAAPRDETAAESWVADPVLLFRYSALTFNGHRIHYDPGHARAEGYPGLVVHGPLLATLLLELARRLGHDRPARFGFRATAPVFAGEPFETCARPEGDGLALWVRGADGRLAMTAGLSAAPARTGAP